MVSSLEREKDAFARVEAPCPLFGACGGCQLQDLAYADQLRLKGRRLSELVGTLEPTVEIELSGPEQPWRYRNKAELAFGDDAQRRLRLGYHAAQSYRRLVDLDDCLLLPEPMSRCWRDVRDLAQQSGLPAYHPTTHRGFFRHLVLRASAQTGHVLACLVTAPGHREVMDTMAEALMARHPTLAGVYWGISEKLADVAVPDALHLLRGQPHLEERIGPWRILVGPYTFLQPTREQAQQLYDTINEWVREAPDGHAWDLYCGTGIVGLYLAAKFRTVYGIDVDSQNLELARRHADQNGVDNLRVYGGPVEALLSNKRFWLREAKPEAVVMDPPRAGLHPRVVPAVLAARPAQLVYVSCNPQAFVRDVRRLCQGFPRYRLRRLRAFDLFPHTPHLEVLGLLERVA